MALGHTAATPEQVNRARRDCLRVIREAAAQR